MYNVLFDARGQDSLKHLALYFLPLAEPWRGPPLSRLNACPIMRQKDGKEG